MREERDDREAALVRARELHMRLAERDLSTDPDVLGVYYGGSIGRGDADPYSDADLRTVVADAAYERFMRARESRAGRWGGVLFVGHEQHDEPALAVHYDTLATIDWMVFPVSRFAPSHWLRRIRVVHDPAGMVEQAAAASRQLPGREWALTADSVEVWAAGALTAAYEACRSLLRGERLQALHEAERFKAAVLAGWEMREGKRPRRPGDWKRIGGERSAADPVREARLLAWHCGPEPEAIRQALADMAAEFVALRRELGGMTGAVGGAGDAEAAIAAILAYGRRPTDRRKPDPLA